ncbi:MAG: hypothetical protein K1W19_01520 [Lachnospiraceae bacterium]
MSFTFEWYGYLLKLLSEHDYHFANYHNWKQIKNPVILRHDVDNDLSKALEMAEFESKREVKSTYFVLISSDFYNIFSMKNSRLIHQIQNYGHEIGLHFDEMKYPQAVGNIDKIREEIIKEADILSYITECPVKTVSMHRPSKAVLNIDLQLPDIINSYGQVFFQEFKYLSDSRRHWREPVEDIISSEKFERIYILTHAFWYYKKEKSMHDTIKDFVNSANSKCYHSFYENFTDLESVMKSEEILA